MMYNLEFLPALHNTLGFLLLIMFTYIIKDLNYESTE